MCRFVVLVCGTLVYGRGDEHEQKVEHDSLIQEALRLGGDGPPSGSAPAEAAAPMLARASGNIRTAPMAMTTPSSFKVRVYVDVSLLHINMPSVVLTDASVGHSDPHVLKRTLCRYRRILMRC